jgi:hypothetical protein
MRCFRKALLPCIVWALVPKGTMRPLFQTSLGRTLAALAVVVSATAAAYDNIPWEEKLVKKLPQDLSELERFVGAIARGKEGQGCRYIYQQMRMPGTAQEMRNSMVALQRDQVSEYARLDAERAQILKQVAGGDMRHCPLDKSAQDCKIRLQGTYEGRTSRTEQELLARFIYLQERISGLLMGGYSAAKNLCPSAVKLYDARQ